MIFALIAMALAAVAGLTDFASGELEEEIEKLEEEIERELADLDVDELIDDLRDWSDPPEQAVTTQGIDQTIEGTDGDDTLAGDAGDADVLLGLAGDDVLMVNDQNSATGGLGRDIFDLYAGSDAVISDFVPGEDSLRVNANEILLFQNPPYAMDWQVTDQGVELHYVSEGAVSDDDNSRIVTLEGLQAPPPVEDVTLVIYDEIQDETFTLFGDEINFAQRMQGTEGDDRIVLDDTYSDYTLATGAGDDSVEFDSFRGVTDLGEGDDTYISRAEIFTNNSFLDPSETVVGGEGNDVITGGETGFIAYGGPGDDTLTSLRDRGVGLLYARLDGGAGDDSIIFGEHAVASGGEGADSFLITPRLAGGPTPSQITDFDPAEDALVIQLATNYAGAGELTLATATYGYGSAILVDGMVAVQFVENLSDLSSVVVLR